MSALEELTPSKVNSRQKERSAVQDAAFAAAAAIALKEVERQAKEPASFERSLEFPPGFSKEDLIDVDVEVEMEGFEDEMNVPSAEVLTEGRTPSRDPHGEEERDLLDKTEHVHGEDMQHLTPKKEKEEVEDAYPLQRSASPVRPTANAFQANHLRSSQFNVRRSFQTWREGAPQHFQAHGLRRSIDVAGRFRARDHPLRVSRASSIISCEEDPIPERAHRSSLSERAFQRELMDVHSEIDKLLGTLKAEVEFWRCDFEALQAFWCELVRDGATGSDGFCSLSEFMRELEVFLEDKAVNEHRLEEQALVLEEERIEMASMLEEAKLELKALHAQELSMAKEKAKLQAAHESSTMSMQSEISGLVEEVTALKEKVEKTTSSLASHNASFHELQKELAHKGEELEDALKEKEDLEVELKDCKESLAKRLERLANLESEIQQCKSVMRRKSDEVEELRINLGVKERELEFMEDALKQRDEHLAEVKQEMATTLKANLDLKDKLESTSRTLSLRDDKILVLSNDLESTKTSRQALETQLADVLAQVKDAAKETEQAFNRITALQTEISTKSSELDASKKDLADASRENAKLQAELKAASQQLLALQTKNDNKESEMQQMKQQNTALAAQIKELCETRDAQELQLKEEARLLEEECHNLMLASQKGKIELEKNLRQKYEQLIATSEAHAEQVLDAQLKKHESEKEELQRKFADELKVKGAQHEETINALNLRFNDRMNELKASHAAQLDRQEKEFYTKMAQKVEEMKGAHEEELRSCSESAERRVQLEAEKWYKYESYLKQKVEKAIQDHARALEEDMSTRMRRFEEEQKAVGEVKKMVGSLSNLWDQTPQPAGSGYDADITEP